MHPFAPQVSYKMKIQVCRPPKKVICLIHRSKNSPIDLDFIFLVTSPGFCQYSFYTTRVIKSSPIGCCAPVWSCNSLLVSSCEWLTFEQLCMGWLKLFHVSNHKMHNHEMVWDQACRDVIWDGWMQLWTNSWLRYMNYFESKNHVNNTPLSYILSPVMEIKLWFKCKMRHSFIECTKMQNVKIYFILAFFHNDTVDVTNQHNPKPSKP